MGSSVALFGLVLVLLVIAIYAPRRVEPRRWPWQRQHATAQGPIVVPLVKSDRGDDSWTMGASGSPRAKSAKKQAAAVADLAQVLGDAGDFDEPPTVHETPARRIAGTFAQLVERLRPKPRNEDDYASLADDEQTGDVEVVQRTAVVADANATPSPIDEVLDSAQDDLHAFEDDAGEFVPSTPQVTSEPAAGPVLAIIPEPVAGDIEGGWTRLIDPERTDLTEAERIGIVESLGVLEEAWAGEIVVRAIAEDPDRAVRAAALRAIRVGHYQDGRDAALDVLLAEEADDREMRVLAVEALAAIGAGDAIELALDDPEEIVATAAALALCTGMSPSAATSYLRDRVNDPARAAQLSEAVCALA